MFGCFEFFSPILHVSNCAIIFIFVKLFDHGDDVKTGILQRILADLPTLKLIF